MAEERRAPLGEFVAAVADQVADGVSRFESGNPEWELGAVEIRARVGYKMHRERGGPLVVMVDLDEPERLLSDLTIPIRRRQ